MEHELESAVSENALSAAELVRYFCPRRRCLMSCRSDGRTYAQRVGEDWRLFAIKKADVQLEEWARIKQEHVSALPVWAQQVTELPSLEEIEAWICDGGCDTPTGHWAEPDGEGPDGVPSWLRCLGLV